MKKELMNKIVVNYIEMCVLIYLLELLQLSWGTKVFYRHPDN